MHIATKNKRDLPHSLFVVQKVSFPISKPADRIYIEEHQYADRMVKMLLPQEHTNSARKAHWVKPTELQLSMQKPRLCSIIFIWIALSLQVELV